MSTAGATSPDTVKFTFEATDRERVSEYDLKLMTIEEEHLAIPDTEYNATLTVGRRKIFSVLYADILQLPSLELQRVLRDLSQFGDTITILAAKDSVTFRLVRQQQQQQQL